ncbi:Uncharacterised protein [Segatella copri]|nr:Uncharacterised protein [Segatella copri]
MLGNLYVTNHVLNTDNISSIRIYLMTIHTLDKNRLSIYQELFSLDLDLSKTDILANDFQYFISIHQCRSECVQIRCFCCPLGYILNG